MVKGVLKGEKRRKMKKTKWTKEMVENESKKYTSRFQFQKNSKYAYNKSLKEGWLNEFVWLRTPEHKENNVNDKIHYVYAYIDEENKSIYIGRTNNVKIRHNRHNNIQHKNKKYDTIKTYFLNNNKDLPLPIILSENLTLEESQYYEDYFLKYYKDNGWGIINKGKTGVGIGSVGGFVQKLTYEYCKSVALTCKTRKEFEKTDSSAYKKSCAMKWIEEFIPNKTHNERSYEECIKVAKKYKSNKDFRMNDLLVYNYCQRKKWLKTFDWLTRKCSFEKRNGISKDEIIEKSKLYKFKNEFIKAYPSHYAKALKKGWLNDLCFEKYQKLTYEEWYNIAKKFETKQNFRKEHPGLVSMAYRYNWFEKCNLFKQVKRKLTKEVCLEIAKNYSTINELRKSDESVYTYLLKNDLLKETSLCYIKNLKIKNMKVEFYKDNLDFPLSGGDIFSNNNRKSIRRILNALKNYIGKKTNVKVNINDKHKILISNLINFCKLEGIDYKQILEIEVIQNGETFQIIVNKGTNEKVQILEID